MRRLLALSLLLLAACPHAPDPLFPGPGAAPCWRVDGGYVCSQQGFEALISTCEASQTKLQACQAHLDSGCAYDGH